VDLRAPIPEATILHMDCKATRRRRSARGFTMIEIMIVVSLIGILAALAIPNYMKMTARAHRSEMYGVISKLRQVFIDHYHQNGTFPPTSTGVADSSWNPADPVAGLPPLGQMGTWKGNDPDWRHLPYAPDSAVRMRYMYSVTNAGKTLTLTAHGRFPGVPGTYSYSESWNGSNPAAALPTEFPQF
jgi:prepilin-type N-terminal cleavage/methylation domain-containing protein